MINRTVQNVQERKLVYSNNRTVSNRDCIYGKFDWKKNCTCMIIQYPRVIGKFATWFDVTVCCFQ